MEALKSIKLFWKILLHKLFNINISKVSNFDNKDNCHNDSARDVARSWQKEMLRQAVFVKALTPHLSRSSPVKNKCSTSCKATNVDNCTHIPKLSRSEGDCADLAQKPSIAYFFHCKRLNCKDIECYCNLPEESKTATLCRYVSVRVKKASVACNTYDDSVSITQFKNENIVQQNEMKRLITENLSLKRELQKVYDEGKWRESCYSPKLSPVIKTPCSLLHTFEENGLTDDTTKVAKDAESEMIITLQNCKNDVSPF